MARKTTSKRIVRVSSFSPAAFAPFGEIVQNPASHNGEPRSLESVSANQGSATKYVDVSHVDNHYNLSRSGKAAKPVMNMFVCHPRQLRHEDEMKLFDVRVLERHPFTPQTFIPMGVNSNDPDTSYLVVVAPTLSAKARSKDDDLSPPYPIPPPRRKRSLREKLLGARPNPFTNDHTPSTTPQPNHRQRQIMPKGPGEPDLDNVQAFIVKGNQAVTYGPGTWHAPMVVLGGKPIEFVVVQYANGVAIEDCQEIQIVAEQGEQGLMVDVEGISFDAAAPGIMRARL